jgi:hypothetical protein
MSATVIESVLDHEEGLPEALEHLVQVVVVLQALGPRPITANDFDDVAGKSFSPRAGA